MKIEDAQKAVQAARELSEGNLMFAIDVTSTDEAGMFLEGMKNAELVQEINAASNEQNTGAEQINKAIQQLDQVIQQNASATEETASTSEELSSQSEQLLEAIGFFKVDTTAKATKRTPAVKYPVREVAKYSPKEALPPAARRTTDRKPGGISLDLDGSGRDAADDEFETF